MKKKILLSVFVVFLVLVLAGCSGVIPVIPDIDQKEEIKEVINNYWSALSNKQYKLAKTYCMLYGDAYYAVEDYQILSNDDNITINWIYYINWINIIGNDATVNMKLTLNVTVCFEDICSSQTETLYNYSMYLTKTDSDWKLK